MKFIKFFIRFWKYISILIWIIFWWFLISYINDKSLYDIIVGFKYIIYFLLIFISSAFIWYIIKKKNLINKLLNFYKFLFYLILFALSFGLIWWLSKLGFKDVFLYIWYWPVGDFIFWQSPPIYYRTWEGGLPRNSWLFSWPNNYWFFLVAFFSFFTYMSMKLWNPKNLLKDKDLKWFVKAFLFSSLYIISWILTLSRGFILWILPQIYYFFWKFFWDIKNIWLYFIAIFLIFIAWLSAWKWDSTVLHFKETISSISFAWEKTLWHWLWTSWPAIHHWWYTLPENMYLQVFIDLWAIGFILWIMFFYFFFLDAKKIISQKSNLDSKQKTLITYFILLTLWLFWLILEWFFLHVFEDSMVNYIFFIALWVLWWAISEN